MKAEIYQIKVRGLISESWSAYFSGMSIAAEPAGVTGIRGAVADQSALYGLLNKVHDLNLKLISVQLLGSDGVTPLECNYCPLNKPSQDRNKLSNISLDG